MNLGYDDFLERLTNIIGRIDNACLRAGRSVGSVRLLAVTKTHGPEAAAWAAQAGLTAVGENRVQEAAEKRPQVEASLRWELIGHLQSNKARQAVQTFDRIQSVDRIKLITALDRFAEEERTEPLPILLQVNAGDDPAKFGCDVAEAPRLLESALAASNLRVDGLMTIAPLSDDPDVARRCFERLRSVRDDLQAQFGVALPELSMGMTDDMEIAIAAGSTCVRIGTALYGKRG